MRVVADLGCVPYGEDESLEHLILKYDPDIVFGFDPAPQLEEGLRRVCGTPVLQTRKAAWVWTGTVVFAPAGLNGTTMQEKSMRGEWANEHVRVSCFDFTQWLRTLPNCELIVKMDIEGSEFPILQKMHRYGADALVSLLLVEWHDLHMNEHFTQRRLELEEELRCEVEAW